MFNFRINFQARQEHLGSRIFDEHYRTSIMAHKAWSCIIVHSHVLQDCSSSNIRVQADIGLQVVSTRSWWYNHASKLCTKHGLNCASHVEMKISYKSYFDHHYIPWYVCYAARSKYTSGHELTHRSSAVGRMGPLDQVWRRTVLRIL